MLPLTKLNINPHGRKTTDCIIRAISVATGIGYHEVLDGLVDTMKTTGYHIGDRICVEKYLSSIGWIKVKQPRKPDGKKYLVGEIGKLTSQNAVITLANHMVAVVDGCIVDIWDCRDKTIGNYFIKTGTK